MQEWQVLWYPWLMAEIKTAPGFKAFRTLHVDTLKLYTAAHGHKTINLIINLDHDEWILSDLSKTLASVGARKFPMVLANERQRDGTVPV